MKLKARVLSVGSHLVPAMHKAILVPALLDPSVAERGFGDNSLERTTQKNEDWMQNNVSLLLDMFNQENVF